MWYVEQKNNPDKHPAMPELYPWATSESFVEGWIEISPEDYAALLASIDLGPYRLAVQTESDYNKYTKRAQAKDGILAEMATENMNRVRAGIWTVPDLVALTQDTQLKQVLDDINTLSFELACQKVAALTNPIVTTEIKNGWMIKLQNVFFTEG